MKKAAALILISGIAWWALGGTPSVPAAGQLAAPVSDIVGSKIENGRVKYAYKVAELSDGEKSAKLSAEAAKAGLSVVAEDASRRDANSRHYLTSSVQTVNGQQRRIMVAEVIPGEPQYFKDPSGRWWQADTASTTIENFDLQTRGTKRDQLVRSMLSPTIVFASSGTFYPDATTIDGRVTQSGSATWATLRGGAGNGSQSAENDPYAWGFDADIGCATFSFMARGVRVYNLTSLSGATVTAVTESLVGIAKADANSDTPDVNIFGGTTLSNTALANADYGTTDTSAFSTAVTYANQTSDSSTYVNFAYNATGISGTRSVQAAINGAGYFVSFTKNANYDNANSAPACVTNGSARWLYASSDNTGTTIDPKLIITYTSAATSGGKQFLMGSIF